MRKLFFLFTFLMIGAVTYADTEFLDDSITTELVTEISENGDISMYSIVVDEFDVCTVTVTITRSDGVVARGRATSNTGDCDAAAAAAEASARATLAAYF